MAERVTDWVGSTSSILVHTVFFVGIFILHIFGVDMDSILLILTTALSIEAIYLAIFIQMTVNRNTKSLEEVEFDIDEIQEDIEDMEFDIDEIQEDIDKIEEEEKLEAEYEAKTKLVLETIEGRLRKLMDNLETIKKKATK